MKKTFILGGMCLAIGGIIPLPAQELQLSFGPEFGLVRHDMDRNFSGLIGGRTFLFSEKSNSLYSTPGIGFTMRYLSENPYQDNSLAAVKHGFFMRSALRFALEVEEKGTGKVEYPNGSLYGFPQAVRIDEKYKLGPDFYMLMFDFTLGSSYQFAFGKRFAFSADLGLNGTVMTSEAEGTKFEYYGFGLYSGLGLQFSFSKTMYVELGLNGILGLISAQKGSYKDGDVTISYEDVGSFFDFAAPAVYVHLGWKIDLEKARKEAEAKLLKKLQDRQAADESRE